MSSSKKVLPWYDLEDSRDYFSLMLNVTRKCNGTCSFCPFCDKRKSISEKDFDKIVTWIKDNFPYTHRYTQISLFGGEPTLFPERCEKMFDVAKELNIDACILYTNMSADIDWYNKMMFKYRNLILSATYHANMYPAEDFVSSKLRYLHDSSRRRCKLKVMEGDKGYEFVKENAEMRGIDVEVTAPHRATPVKEGSCSEIEDDVTILSTQKWHELVETGRNSFKGATCLAGSNNLYIEYNGDVFPCQGIGHRSYKESSEQKTPSILPMGNVIKGTAPSMAGNPETTCPMNSCRFELYLTKYYM